MSKTSPDIGYNCLETCHEFICSLLESESKKVRGPFLARLELHRVLREQGLDANGLLGDFGQLLLEYFRNFGDKSCCAHDMKLFIKHLTKEQYSGFQETMLQMAALPEDGSGSMEDMIKHICALQVSRCCDTMSRERDFLEPLAIRLAKLYETYRKKYGVDLLSTDISPCDQFALLAGE